AGLPAGEKGVYDERIVVREGVGKALATEVSALITLYETQRRASGVLVHHLIEELVALCFAREGVVERPRVWRGCEREERDPGREGECQPEPPPHPGPVPAGTYPTRATTRWKTSCGGAPGTRSSRSISHAGTPTAPSSSAAAVPASIRSRYRPSFRTSVISLSSRPAATPSSISTRSSPMSRPRA